MKGGCEHIGELITENISDGSYDDGCWLINTVICSLCQKVYDITLALDSVEERLMKLIIDSRENSELYSAER